MIVAPDVNACTIVHWHPNAKLMGALSYVNMDTGRDGNGGKWVGIMLAIIVVYRLLGWVALTVKKR